VAVSESFIAGLPKVELHVHHGGSVPLRAVAELAARHPGTVPSDLDELARYFIFDDFPHFIRNYLAVVDLIKTAEDVRLITYEVAADMAAQNIRYAELTVTPYISISDSLPAEAFLEAIEDARQAAHRDHGLELWWIFDIPADFGVPAAELTASVALDHDVPGLIGFGLGGTDRGFPRSMFRDQFDRARAAGLRSVPHAGETTGPESVWDALVSLGAERIEHGIAAVGDPRLLEHLVEHKIALDICLTSNVALRVVPDLIIIRSESWSQTVSRWRSTPTTRQWSAPTSIPSTPRELGCLISMSRESPSWHLRPSTHLLPAVKPRTR
jgi:aminodeoxyfutalosine deaminase